MKNIKTLEPKAVWSIFDEITQVPRPSKHEQQICEYLHNFAQTHALDLKQDEKGNIVIRKAATAGYENKEGVILQSHVDMVCEKEASLAHNFMTDPIDAYVDGGWVRARGTTLGADCGIGMALQMAVLASTDMAHPAIEALFTVDEEQGLTGAMGLGSDMLTFHRMINLDSEDEGEIFIGCAGGIDTLATFTYNPKKISAKDHAFYTLRVGGLAGGHSGDDIEKGRANANKLAARFLWEFFTECDVRLISFDGGNLRNAIPREAMVEIAIHKSDRDTVMEIFSSLAQQIKAEFKLTEPDMLLSLESGKESSVVISRTSANLLVASLVGVPNGVQAMSPSMKGLVETSTNLASVKMKGDNRIEVVTSQRSSVESAKHAIASAVESVFLLAEADVAHSDGYPGWEPNPSSAFVKSAGATYKSLFARAPKIKAIHAGLECGLFLTKYPELDMISIGPTLRGVHSPSERLEIATVEKTWTFLRALLAL